MMMTRMTQDQLNERLFKVVRSNDISAVKKAIKDGADVNARYLRGLTSGWTPLHYAAVEGYTKMAQILIDNGADVKAEDESGFPAVMYAIRDQNYETAKLILERLLESKELMKLKGE